MAVRNPLHRDRDRARRRPQRRRALARMAEAEDTLRAIGAGEVDAFVVSDGGLARRVFTLSTADRPYRMLVENMQDGAMTVSSSGLILYANRRLGELLSCSTDPVVGAPLTRVIARRGIPTGSSGESEARRRRRPGRSRSWWAARSWTWTATESGSRTFTDLSDQKAQESEIARLSWAQAARLDELQAAQSALTGAGDARRPDRLAEPRDGRRPPRAGPGRIEAQPSVHRRPLRRLISSSTSTTPADTLRATRCCSGSPSGSSACSGPWTPSAASAGTSSSSSRRRSTGTCTPRIWAPA